MLRIPIAHAEDNYHTDPVTEQSNPNGSLDNIAGIRNAAGNVLGLMPHPERCAESVLGNQDGQLLFRSMIDSVMSGQDKKQTTP